MTVPIETHPLRQAGPRPEPPQARAVLEQMLADLRQGQRARAACQQAAEAEYASWLRPRS